MAPNKSDSGELERKIMDAVTNVLPYSAVANNEDEASKQVADLLNYAMAERFCEAIMPVVTAHIQAVGEEIIGEDDSITEPYPIPTRAKEIYGNALRAEQRQRLAQYLGDKQDEK